MDIRQKLHEVIGCFSRNELFKAYELVKKMSAYMDAKEYATPDEEYPATIIGLPYNECQCQNCVNNRKKTL